MIRKDGLTSEQRKEKYTHIQLRRLALEAYNYFQENGWEPLTDMNISRLRQGTTIRCCEYACGCFGQAEKIALKEWRVNSGFRSRGGHWRRILHTNHNEPMGIIESYDSPDKGSIDIEFALIRRRKED